MGTDLVTSRDVPALSVVYKLVETEAGGVVAPKTKFSEEKVYWPGRKQVFRFSEGGQYHHDLLACAQEDYPEASPLLEPVDAGRPAPGAGPAGETNPRAHAGQSGLLPEAYLALRGAPVYPVEKSAGLDQLLEEVRAQHFGAVKASDQGGGI